MISSQWLSTAVSIGSINPDAFRISEKIDDGDLPLATGRCLASTPRLNDLNCEGSGEKVRAQVFKPNTIEIALRS
jgi:hypothetical protein